MFDLKRTPKPDPSWVVEGDKDTKLLYKLVMNMAVSIDKLIASGEKLSAGQRKISYTSVGIAYGRNAAYINRRDTPEIYQLISSLNDTFSHQYKARSKPKSNKKPGRTSELARMSRSELLSECQSRGKRIRELEDELAKDGLTAIYQEAIDTQRFGNSSYVKTLETQLYDANETVESLQLTVKNLKSEIISLNAGMVDLALKKECMTKPESKNPTKLKPVQ
jgi:hypothetical protein